MAFSIIIPVYNVAPYLRECLDSVLAQTYTDWEAICVDDGSTDGSGEILDEYAAKDKRFKVIHKKNEGVSVARNTALEKIVGEWFLFLDSDDVLRVDALDLLRLNGMDEKTDGLLITPYIPYWDGGEVPPRQLETKVLIPNAAKEDLILGPYAANGFVISRVYRRSLFGDLRFRSDMHMAEDHCFWFDALRIEARWTITQAEYYLYRQRQDSVCGRSDPHDLGLILDAFLYAFDAIDKGVLKVAEGKKNYFNRFPGAIKAWLEIAVQNAAYLSNDEWKDIVAKLEKLIDGIGKWPFGTVLCVRFYAASHKLTRWSLPVIDMVLQIKHLFGCLLRKMHLRK